MIPLKELCARLGAGKEDESLVLSLAREAEDYARAYCRLPGDEPLPDSLIVRMTAEDWGRAEGAGLRSRTLSGIADSYRDGYSEDVMRHLRVLRHPGTPSRRDCSC